MQDLLQKAADVADLLKARHQTLAVGEAASGGLISAALLAQAGASAYFLGGAVVYTAEMKRVFLHLPADEPRSSSEAYALLLARTMREKLGATWGVSESGAAGPSGNRYGDAAGHTCIAVTGPVQRVVTIESGHGDRVTNMRRFAAEALALLEACLIEAGAA
jgi:nicotinamide-nucleotide amidase